MTQNPYAFPSTDERDGGERAVRIELGEGKVSGSVVIQYVGDGGIIIGTLGAHVNDDRPGIVYSDEGYIGRIWVKRNADGEWVVDPDNAWNQTKGGVHFTRRDNWSDAGKVADRMITRRLLDAMAEHYSPERERLGDAAEAERDAYRAWNAYAEAKAKADEARKVLRSAERKLDRARKAVTQS